MEYKIYLDANRLARLPETIIIEKEHKKETILLFASSTYDLGRLGVTITNGYNARSILLDEPKLDISEFCEKACVIDINIQLITRGKTIKTWELEPITVRELDGRIEAIPEIALIREEMEKRLSAIEDKINQYESEGIILETEK